MSDFPLVVDLDGTLIRTDMLHETALQVCRERPLELARFPSWLSSGKAVLKQKLAERCLVNVASLPYHLELIEWLKLQREAGRSLILCTATDISLATAIAAHLDIFDDVIASDGVLNVAGKHKARVLVDRFGHQGFDYAGNSNADMHVWESARRAVIVNATPSLVKKAETSYQVERIFPKHAVGLNTVRRMLRLHQWLKNALLFIPLFAAHQLANAAAWDSLLIGFLSFSLCSSSVYIANDVMDLESDRLHPRKRSRPFASGSAPLWLGLAMAPVLLTASLLLAIQVDGAFLSWLMVYFVITCAYSWGLKRLVLIDCLTLAVLYTLRIVAGAAAAGLELSNWLLAFSGFLFLSLAFVKRYAELQVQLLQGNEKIHGRAYLTSDAPLVQILGVTSGYAAIIVLSLYLHSDTVTRLYQTPDIVWGAVPVMLFWISWMWLRAHRGQMHDDPLVFAVKDKASLLAGAAFVLVLALASTAW